MRCRSSTAQSAVYPPKLIAVDTNVLLDLAKGYQQVSDCVATLKQSPSRPGRFVVTPTVIHELMYLADTDRQAREYAHQALSELKPVWGFEPLNCLPVGHGIVEQIGKKLRVNGLLPEEEMNDSFILAEAALANAAALLTSDSHILQIDESLLRSVLEECEVGVPLLCSPWRVSNFAAANR